MGMPLNQQGHYWIAGRWLNQQGLHTESMIHQGHQWTNRDATEWQEGDWINSRTGTRYWVSRDATEPTGALLNKRKVTESHWISRDATEPTGKPMNPQERFSIKRDDTESTGTPLYQQRLGFLLRSASNRYRQSLSSLSLSSNRLAQIPIVV